MDTGWQALTDLETELSGRSGFVEGAGGNEVDPKIVLGGGRARGGRLGNENGVRSGGLGGKRVGLRLGLGLGQFLAEFDQAIEGVLVGALQAGLVAVDEFEGVAAAGGRGEGRGKALKRGVGFGDAEVTVEGSGLDGFGADEAPVSCDHLLDAAEFDVIGGAETPDVVLEALAEEVRILIGEHDEAGELVLAARAGTGDGAGLRGDGPAA